MLDSNCGRLNSGNWYPKPTRRAFSCTAYKANGRSGKALLEGIDLHAFGCFPRQMAVVAIVHLITTDDCESGDVGFTKNLRLSTLFNPAQHAELTETLTPYRSFEILE
jgi:hypothetical protein